MLSVGAAKLVRWIVLALLALPVAFAAVPPPPAPPTPDVDAVAGPVLLAPPETIWTSMNMGAGSGLDADTLDGLDSAALLAALAAETAAREALEARVADLESRLPRTYVRDHTLARENAVCDMTNRAFPAFTLTLTTDRPTLLVVNANPTMVINDAVYTYVYVDGEATDVDGAALTSTRSWHPLATIGSKVVGAGEHTVEIRYWCRGSAVILETGTMVVQAFPQ